MPERPLSAHIRKPIKCDHCGADVPKSQVVQVTDETGTFPVCPRCEGLYK